MNGDRDVTRAVGQVEPPLAPGPGHRQGRCRWFDVAELDQTAGQGFDVKLTTGLHGGSTRLLVNGTSTIKDITDLSGKTIGVFSLSGPTRHFFSILLSRHGVDPETQVHGGSFRATCCRWPCSAPKCRRSRTPIRRSGSRACGAMERWWRSRPIYRKTMPVSPAARWECMPPCTTRSRAPSLR